MKKFRKGVIFAVKEQRSYDMKHPSDTLSAPVWPGSPVPLSEMMPYLDAVMTPERLAMHLHYAYASGNAINRSAETLCTMRLVFYETDDPFVAMAGFFDGIDSKRRIYDKDILIGGYNAFTSAESQQTARYKGFSIIFHLSHIRLHYCEFDCGTSIKNIYYHTQRPATGILALLLEALDGIIHESGTSRRERCQPLLSAILQQLRFELTSEDTQKQDKQSKLARQLKNYLEHNFSKDIDCNSVSSILGVNRSYASSVFNMVFGMTMKGYLIKLRLEAAETLLLSAEQLRIEDIALLCGFSTTNYFIRVFRTHYNCTPGEFRERGRLNSEKYPVLKNTSLTLSQTSHLSD